MRGEARGRRPWHQWLVGLPAVFLTGIGALDFVMMHTDRAAWLARLGLGEQAGAYFRDYPLAADLCWAVAVWASFAGAVLLLLRRAAAWAFFVAALIGQLLLDAYTFGFRGRWQALGARLGIQDLIVLGLTGLLAAYTWWQARRGELIA